MSRRHRLKRRLVGMQGFGILIAKLRDPGELIPVDPDDEQLRSQQRIQGSPFADAVIWVPVLHQLGFVQWRSR